MVVQKKQDYSGTNSPKSVPENIYCVKPLYIVSKATIYTVKLTANIYTVTSHYIYCENPLTIVCKATLSSVKSQQISCGKPLNIVCKATLYTVNS